MKKGLTLIEILVTALILSIGVASMMFSFVYCKQIAIRNSHKNNASMIINHHFEQIQRCETSLALDDYLDNVEKEVWKQISDANKNFKYFVTVQNAGTIDLSTGTDLSLVRARVEWGDDDHEALEMYMISNEPI
ncbi:MAG: type II secretion system protein [Candidatus Delongbacteria bacterium]